MNACITYELVYGAGLCERDCLSIVVSAGGLAQGKNPTAQMAMERMTARKIINGAQALLIERAQELQTKARAALESLPKGQSQEDAKKQVEDNQAQPENLQHQHKQNQSVKAETQVGAKRRADLTSIRDDVPRQKRGGGSK